MNGQKKLSGTENAGRAGEGKRRDRKGRSGYAVYKNAGMRKRLYLCEWF